MPPALAPSPMPSPGAARATAGAATASDYLTFRLGHHEFGIDNTRVLEIRGHEPPASVASDPNFIKGVLKLRGSMIPVVDIRPKLQILPSSHDGFTVTIVLKIGQGVVGVVVDVVSDLIRLEADQIQAAPEPKDGEHSEHLIGVGVINSGGAARVIHLLDMAHLISEADMALTEPALT